MVMPGNILSLLYQAYSVISVLPTFSINLIVSLSATLRLLWLESMRIRYIQLSRNLARLHNAQTVDSLNFHDISINLAFAAALKIKIILRSNVINARHESRAPLILSFLPMSPSTMRTYHCRYRTLFKSREL